TLDFFISKIPNHINTFIENNCDLSSDHSPILLSINGDVLLNSRPSFTNGPIDWDKFKFNLDQNINLKVALKIHSDTHIAAEGIVRTIQQAAIKATSPIYPHILNSSKSLPADIKQLLIYKRHVRAKWQSTRLPSRKKKFLTNLLKYKLHMQKSEQFQLYMKSLQPDNGSFGKQPKGSPDTEKKSHLSGMKTVK
ncbi:putative RNA-directed DNA polymerase, partial [Aphis craccivora]